MVGFRIERLLQSQYSLLQTFGMSLITSCCRWLLWCCCCWAGMQQCSWVLRKNIDFLKKPNKLGYYFPPAWYRHFIAYTVSSIPFESINCIPESQNALFPFLQPRTGIYFEYSDDDSRLLLAVRYISGYTISS
jgi:hypothetical protein